MAQRTLRHHLKPQVNLANLNSTKCKQRSRTRTKFTRLQRNKIWATATGYVTYQSFNICNRNIVKLIFRLNRQLLCTTRYCLNRSIQQRKALYERVDDLSVYNLSVQFLLLFQN